MFWNVSIEISETFLYSCTHIFLINIDLPLINDLFSWQSSVVVHRHGIHAQYSRILYDWLIFSTRGIDICRYGYDTPSTAIIRLTTRWWYVSELTRQNRLPSSSSSSSIQRSPWIPFRAVWLTDCVPRLITSFSCDR